MNMTDHERPGVYSSYDASAIVSGSGTGKTVGLVGVGTCEEVGTVVPISRQEEAVAAFGTGTALTELVRLLLLNGAAAVRAVAVTGTEDYAAAFAALEAEEDVGIVVCDSEELTVQQALRDSVKASAKARRERIAVVCGAKGETVTQLTTRAAGLNDERVVLVAPGCLDVEGDPVGGDLCAAAVAGLIAGQSDPAVPLGGAVLSGLTGLDHSYSDNEIDQLVQGGVTALESLAGQISVVRGVTTRTTTGGAADITWRELTTILVVDEVIPGIRQALRAKFPRAKNTPQTRGAVLAQVIVELENRVAREVIDSYEDVTVSALESDPTVCLVEFAFTVAHGLNQIWLSAHITV